MELSDARSKFPNFRLGHSERQVRRLLALWQKNGGVR